MPGVHPVKATFGEYNKDLVTFARAVQDSEYRLPHNVAGLWQHLNPTHVLDIGCGWGSNALVDSGSNLLEVAARPGWDGQYHPHLRPARRAWTGVDVADGAAAWCKETGLYTHTYHHDVARHPLPEVKGVDLVLSTGAAGYIGANMVDHVSAATTAPWMITLLAWEDMQEWQDAFAAAGRDMTHVAVVAQRHFITEQERDAMHTVPNKYVQHLAQCGWASANVWYIPPA